MKRFFVAAGFLLTCTALFAQEVVVFKNNRSMVVESHREDGAWTYLKIDGGEMAVRSTLIQQIRKEGKAAMEAGKAASKPTTNPRALPGDPSPPQPVLREEEEFEDEEDWEQEFEDEEDLSEDEKEMEKRRERIQTMPQPFNPSEGQRKGRIPRGGASPKKG